ncbi:nucleoid-associated protein [Verrucomicrobiaceae bacterium R5-34]|uniref:Nucleoid-associated protein n=1 Tax=Oceaniferula flava TaxID=2800421 RepID=A0AAE2VBG6_9BACT|nr:nucleoid-associated protein [Oceaniferula flavus]MBK1830427.1 nucleoid-associated protein [Verrucomicrobiaceae bacterium R5-34]MBK1854520.1 nucleoid-associated protein [Oceaniferula flavus]MBM1135826.1 nucleoid-associated protein [Oceaniferula flavus]
MPHTLNFRRAKLTAMALARVGNPLRSEPLKTSKELCQFSAEDNAVLTPSFLKPFKSLERRAFDHHSSLELNEVYRYAGAIFEDPDKLCDLGRKIARHLYNTSKHPNIKSGDLCVALIKDLLVDGEPLLAISLIKSESRVPFLEVTDSDGNLQLVTHQGISPDKIDKGCLIVNCDKEGGFLVYTFDKTSSGTNFWMRDFLGVKFRRDDDFMTKRYADMCVSFAKEGLPEEMGAEEKCRVANNAIGYFEERDEFDLKHFREEALKEPEIIEKFDEFRELQDEEDGAKLDETFTIDKKIARKAGNRFRSTIKLDSGVNISFSPAFKEADDSVFERGFDEGKQMKFVKVYYEEEL